MTRLCVARSTSSSSQTHRASGQEIAVEVKSRRRSGVLKEPGEADSDNPLRKDARMVRQLFKKAVEKAPEGMPYFIFIDINAPLDAEVDERWRSEDQQWMNRLPAPTAEEPDVFNALYVTNFSPPPRRGRHQPRRIRGSQCYPSMFGSRCGTHQHRAPARF